MTTAIVLDNEHHEILRTFLSGRLNGLRAQARAVGHSESKADELLELVGSAYPTDTNEREKS